MQNDGTGFDAVKFAEWQKALSKNGEPTYNGARRFKTVLPLQHKKDHLGHHNTIDIPGAQTYTKISQEAFKIMVVTNFGQMICANTFEELRKKLPYEQNWKIEHIAVYKPKFTEVQICPHCRALTKEHRLLDLTMCSEGCGIIEGDPVKHGFECHDCFDINDEPKCNCK